MNVWGHPNRGIPTLPKVLAIIGILPLLLGACLLFPAAHGIRAHYGIPSYLLAQLCSNYAAVITVFLGGIYWGIALTMYKQLSHRSTSISPNMLLLWGGVMALMGWLALLDIYMAVAALLAQWLGDAMLTKQALIPQWWIKLRGMVTPFAIIALLVIAHVTHA